LQDKAKRYEDVGFNALHLPDHLGAPAPFPVLTAIASATTTVRLGTYVLNAGFYKPALLARDAAEVDQLSDGRLDLGLGAGYVREEFEAAELPYPTARQRVDHLEHVTTYMKKHLPKVPILIAGNGNRLLTIAAPHRVRPECRRRQVRRSRVEPRDHRRAVGQFRETRPGAHP
jgi:probable F420-dependent oxidoreductase